MNQACVVRMEMLALRLVNCFEPTAIIFLVLAEKALLVSGPTSTKTAPLKTNSGEVITGQSKQLQRWVEHYLELNAIQNVVTNADLNALPSRPVMEELGNLPTMEETIDHLTCRKAPGKDGIPPDVLKSGKPALLQHLHEFLCPAGKKGYVPHDMRHVNIVTFYKNKGDRSDYNSYSGISPLSIVGNIFARLISWLACSFKAGRSTVDVIFTLRKLQGELQGAVATTVHRFRRTD